MFLHTNCRWKLSRVLWDAYSDILNYEVKLDEGSKVVSKRNILNNLGRIFDPSGLIAPIVVIARIMIATVRLEQWTIPECKAKLVKYSSSFRAYEGVIGTTLGAEWQL